MESEAFTEEERKASKEVMEEESKNLLSEIDPLDRRRQRLGSRLKNVLDLAFATVNLEDSQQMRKLTEATVRDSATMKQVSFFPKNDHRTRYLHTTFRSHT